MVLPCLMHLCTIFLCEILKRMDIFYASYVEPILFLWFFKMHIVSLRRMETGEYHNSQCRCKTFFVCHIHRELAGGFDMVYAGSPSEFSRWEIASIKNYVRFPCCKESCRRSRLSQRKVELGRIQFCVCHHTYLSCFTCCAPQNKLRKTRLSISLYFRWPKWISNVQQKLLTYIHGHLVEVLWYGNTSLIECVWAATTFGNIDEFRSPR